MEMVGETMANQWDVRRLAGALGAEVRGLRLADADDGDIAEIKRLLVEHMVLFFPEQNMSMDEHVALGRPFGPLEGHPNLKDRNSQEHPEVFALTASQGGIADEWHTDLTFQAEPALMSILNMVKCPDTGGDTCFMSMYAALDALPTDIREAIRGKSLNHDSSHDSAGNLRSNHTAFEDVSGAPGAQHPIVRAHPETGRPALFLGRRLHAWIVGESVESSEALLDRIWEHCTRQEFTYCHQWQRGDLLMWDNRCTMHRRDPFDAQARRVMHRTQLKGDAPVRAAASA